MSISRIMREAVGKSAQGRSNAARQAGPMVATVTNNVDEEGRYRIKVKYKWLHDTEESHWVRITSAMSGTGETGAFWLPEVDDEVLVGFADGDMEKPYVIGSCWNGVNKSPRKISYSPQDVEESVPNQDQGGKNDFRFIRSRMKHHIMFKDRPGEGSISLRTVKSNELYLDDTDGAEKIQLYDFKRQQWLEIDVPGKKITMETDTGDILIKAKNTITLECKDLVVDASATIKVKSGSSSEWKAGSTLKWESSSTSDYKAGGNMTIKAPKIDLNP